MTGRTPLTHALRASLVVRALLCLVAALAVALPARAADDDVDAGPDAPCACASKRACYHFLRAPYDPPEGGCWCPACEPGSRHQGNERPKGWNGLCFQTRNEDCFLKRHAASWDLVCSACMADTDCCNQPSPETCPQCQDGGTSPFPREAAQRAAEQLGVEEQVFGKGDAIVVWSRRFYVVSDLGRIRVHNEQGGLRWMDGHEWAHVMLERAERAYRDFSRTIGPVRIGRPVGIFLPTKESVAKKVKAAYFRNPRVHMVYGAFGSSGESNIAGGFCLNGFCVSGQKVGTDDRAWHQAVRHNLGHIFASNWVKTQGENRTLPRWMYTGVAHWLGKAPPFLRDEVFYCEGEARKVSGPGKDWADKLLATAKRDGFDPIEEWLAKDALGQLSYDDHVRSWGLFDTLLTEWRRPFVALLGDLRREVPVREAFTNRLGMTPEELHARWQARLLGKIRHMDPEEDKRTAPAGPDSPADDASLTRVERAAALRSMGAPATAAQVARLLAAIAHADPDGGDLVRETALQLLLKTDTAEARGALIESGLSHAHPMVRAYAARVCRRRKLGAAREALRALHADARWLVRAEAALASAAIGDVDAQAALRRMLADSSPKVRIAATDALVSLGDDVNPVCVPLVAENVAHADWQVRIAACQALARIGDRHAVGPLVERLQIEGGRVAEEIRAALRAITYDDLGPDPKAWKRWWEKEEARVAEQGGFVKPKTPVDDGRYARDEPTHYGIRLFSQRIGFVLDVSGSTERAFALDDATKKRLAAHAPDASVLGLFQGEILRSLAELDPRTRLALVAFGSDVRRWKDGTTPLSAGNRSSAASFVTNRQPSGETNMHGALVEVLDLVEGARDRSGFGDTPDTITFLTDGSPTVGDVTDPDTLLDWYTEWNRYARIRTHVVVYGSLGVDEDLLKALASRNEGEFVQVREHH